MAKGRLGLAIASLMSAAVIAAAPVRSQDAGNFQVRTTSDLIALCSASPSSPNYVAAIHFCHGFAAGAYHYYSSVEAAYPTAKFICPPNPPPTRNQAIAGYLTWVRSNPNVLSERAVDSMFRYLGTTYPCRQQ